MDRGLLNHGAGHVVYKVSREKGMDVRQAGLELIDGKHWDDVLKSFGK
jgi:D-ornithine 4,5-aminomutase subunit alpha